MDPFMEDPSLKGGDLYFNLGSVSEDILKDGRQMFENGMSPTGDPSVVDSTVWGYVPRNQPLVAAFDNNPASRESRRGPRWTQRCTGSQLVCGQLAQLSEPNRGQYRTRNRSHQRRRQTLLETISNTTSRPTTTHRMATYSNGTNSSTTRRTTPPLSKGTASHSRLPSCRIWRT